MTAWKKTSDGAAVVAIDYDWQPIETCPPGGGKVQLINRRYGVAVYGSYHGDPQWTHWAPLPRFKDDDHGQKQEAQ